MVNNWGVKKRSFSACYRFKVCVYLSLGINSLVFSHFSTHSYRRQGDDRSQLFCQDATQHHGVGCTESLCFYKYRYAEQRLAQPFVFKKKKKALKRLA